MFGQSVHSALVCLLKLGIPVSRSDLLLSFF